MRSADSLSSARIAAAGLSDWRQLAGPVRARFLTANFAQAHDFAGAVGAAAESAGLSPEITLTASNVIVTVSSEDERGVTAGDLELARAISALAADAGLRAAPASLQQVNSLSTPPRVLRSQNSMRPSSTQKPTRPTQTAASSTRPGK